MDLNFKIAKSIIALIIFGGCELAVEVPRPDFQSKLALFGLFEKDSTFGVWITSDKYLLDNEPTSGVNGADVQLFEDDVLIGEFEEAEVEGFDNYSRYENSVIDGFYEMNYLPIPGRTYRVEASRSDFPSVTASSVIEEIDYNFEIIGIDSVEQEDFYGFGPENYNPLQYYIDIEIDDPPGETYYLIGLQAENYDLEYYQDPETGFDYDSIVNITLVTRKHRSNGTGFIFDQQEWYGENTIFSDEYFDGEKYEIRLATELNSNQEFLEEFNLAKPRVYLQVDVISEDYFTFLKSYYIQDWNTENPFVEPIPIISNVENGYGIFSGYQSKTKEVIY